MQTTSIFKLLILFLIVSSSNLTAGLIKYHELSGNLVHSAELSSFYKSITGNLEYFNYKTFGQDNRAFYRNTATNFQLNNSMSFWSYNVGTLTIYPSLVVGGSYKGLDFMPPVGENTEYPHHHEASIFDNVKFEHMQVYLGIAPHISLNREFANRFQFAIKSQAGIIPMKLRSEFYETNLICGRVGLGASIQLKHKKKSNEKKLRAFSLETGLLFDHVLGGDQTLSYTYGEEFNVKYKIESIYPTGQYYYYLSFGYIFKKLNQ